MPISIKLPVGGGSGIDTSDATATIDDIALDKTAYVNGTKITGNANITTLNLFSQTTQPTTYDGFWVNTSNNVNKMAQVDDFLSEWNSTYVTPMPQAKYGFACVQYEGKIYCIGGTNGSSVLNTNYIYNITTNKWSIGKEIPSVRCFMGGVGYNGKIYVIGGTTNNTTCVPVNTTYIYDIATDTWSTGNAISSARCFINPVLYNGKIYCIGGFTGSANTNTTYIYDISGNSWSSGTVMPVTKRDASCTLYNGKIYVIGGYLTNVSTNTTYIYDISGNSWSSGTVMPVAKNSFNGVEYNGKIYCIGGSTSGTFVNNNYIYDTVNNSWATGTPMNTNRANYISALYDNRIYCIGGFNSSSLNTPELYFPDGSINISLYNSDTLILQGMNSYQPYSTLLVNSSSFVGEFNHPFTDVAINGVNADIYYGDGSQWIKIRSAT